MSKVKTLYHISYEYGQVINKFIPRVPPDYIRAQGEDGVTPRICASTKINGCLTAMPEGGSNIMDQLDRFYEHGISGVLYNLYEFKIEQDMKKYIDTPTKLYRQDKVIDSFLTKEYWIKKEIEPTKRELILLTDVELTEVPVISYEFELKIRNCKDPIKKNSLIDKAKSREFLWTKVAKSKIVYLSNLRRNKEIIFRANEYGFKELKKQCKKLSKIYPNFSLERDFKFNSAEEDLSDYKISVKFKKGMNIQDAILAYMKENAY